MEFSAHGGANHGDANHGDAAHGDAAHGDASRLNGDASAERIELSVVDWLRSELDGPEITSSDNFIDVGGHSLAFSKLNTFLADSFGIVLDQKITYGESISTAVAKMRPARATDLAAVQRSHA